MERILSACRGEGKKDGRPETWKLAAKQLWKRGGRAEEDFEAAYVWEEVSVLDGGALRHYSRLSNEKGHLFNCKRALRGLGKIRNTGTARQ